MLEFWVGGSILILNTLLIFLMSVWWNQKNILKEKVGPWAIWGKCELLKGEGLQITAVLKSACMFVANNINVRHSHPHRWLKKGNRSQWQIWGQKRVNSGIVALKTVCWVGLETLLSQTRSEEQRLAFISLWLWCLDQRGQVQQPSPLAPLLSLWRTAFGKLKQPLWVLSWALWGTSFLPFPPNWIRCHWFVRPLYIQIFSHISPGKETKVTLLSSCPSTSSHKVVPDWAANLQGRADGDRSWSLLRDTWGQAILTQTAWFLGRSLLLAWLGMGDSTGGFIQLLLKTALRLMAGWWVQYVCLAPGLVPHGEPSLLPPGH